MTTQNVQQLLQKLQALDSRALFLVGGSIERGDGGAESDIDIYCVASLWKLIFLRKKICQFLTTVSLPVNCMLVPKLFFKWGWYYSNGVSTTGERYTSREDANVIIRNCLIFALYHLLTYKVLKTQHSFVKARQQIAVLIRYKAKNYHSISFAKSEIEPFTTGITESNVTTIVEQFLRTESPKLTFSWSAFWLYNMHFLKQALLLNLRLNPAILVLHKLEKELSAPTQKGLQKMRKIIFPVYILTNHKPHV